MRAVGHSPTPGVRLWSWLGLSEDTFYGIARVAIVPMGSCFPGHDARKGDLPPRRECAALWRVPVLSAFPTGLPQVCAFMRLIGGRVDVASEPGFGTTFDLLFPSAQTRGRSVPSKSGELRNAD